MAKDHTKLAGTVEPPIYMPYFIVIAKRTHWEDVKLCEHPNYDAAMQEAKSLFEKFGYYSVIVINGKAIATFSKETTEHAAKPFRYD